MPPTSAAIAAKTAIMLALQDEMNRRVDADWLVRDRAWYRAVWIECAELMDHYGGWKWWKAGAPDLAQALLEVVDIWHFGLSMRIDAARDHRTAAARIAEEWRHPLPSSGFLRDVETLATVALAERRFLVAAVPTLLAALGSDFDALYRTYVGKNVLNVFRQDHGYRDGRYRKVWEGREDNAHLAEVLATLDSDAPDYRAQVYAALAGRYGGG